MPRCPNGSRKNRKTGECESTSKSSRCPEGRCRKSVSKSKKRCPNGTRRNPKTGVCESQSRKSKLSDSQIEEIINDHNSFSPEEKVEVRLQLKKLTPEKEYVSCFGERPKDLFSQAIAKSQCWAKYRDPIV